MFSDAKFTTPKRKFTQKITTWNFSIVVLQNVLNFAWLKSYVLYQIHHLTQLKSWNYVIATSSWYRKMRKWRHSAKKDFAKDSKNRILQHFATRQKLQYPQKMFFTCHSHTSHKHLPVRNETITKSSRPQKRLDIPSRPLKRPEFQNSSRINHIETPP
jgi:hypothetical protein